MKTPLAALGFSITAAALAFIFPSFLPSEAKDWGFVRSGYIPFLGVFLVVITVCAFAGSWSFFRIRGPRIVLRATTGLLLLFSYLVVAVGFLAVSGFRR